MPEPTNTTPQTLVFYDANCSVCLGFQSFAEARDADRRLRFEPLEGSVYEERISAPLRAARPDSVIALTPEGDELLRTAAVQFVLIALGGPWALFGRLLGWLPSAATDRTYRFLARHRKRFQRG